MFNFDKEDIGLSFGLLFGEPHTRGYGVEPVLYEIDIEHEDSDGNKINLGELYCLLISDGLENSRDIADSHDADLIVAVTPVTDKDGYLLDANSFRQEILYIDRFYIKPEYRNMGVGTIAFNLLEKFFKNQVGVITVIPTPCDDEGKNKIEINTPLYTTRLLRWISFLESLGFDIEGEVGYKYTCYR